MFNNLSKEEMIILGFVGVGIASVVYLYARKKGLEAAKEEISKMGEIIKEALPEANKKDLLLEQAKKMKESI